MKNKLYDCTNLWENSSKIIGWTTQKILKNDICYGHQPLLYNTRITKPGKMIKADDLPEFDFGDSLDIRTLEENRIEIFSNEDETTKKLTLRIFLKLNSRDAQNFPTCDE